MPFEVAVRTNSDGSEVKSLSNGEIFWLHTAHFRMVVKDSIKRLND